MLYLAVYTDEEHKVGVEEISKGLGLPKHFLAKILQHLTRHNLASSSKGRNGGFYLNQLNKDSSLLPVIQSLDGKELFTGCILGLKHCSEESPCTLHSQAIIHRNEMMRILGEKSIIDIAQNIDLKKIII